ncbi:MAG: hypothetical protein V3U14_12810 [candidate division NC10 bacterium]
MPPEEGTETESLDAAATAAVTAASETPPEDVFAIPEGEVEDAMFPLSYVQKLRDGGAKYRTERNELAAPFEGIEDDVRDGYLTLIQTLHDDPKAALPKFEEVVSSIKEEFGLTEKEAETVVKKAVVETADPETPKFLTADEAEAKFKEMRATETAEAKLKAATDGHLADALELSEDYVLGGDQLVALFHVAKNDPEAGGTLAGAHEVLSKRLGVFATQVIDDYRKGLREGTTHPPATPVGDGAAKVGDTTKETKIMTPDERMKAASRRANERMEAGPGV